MLVENVPLASYMIAEAMVDEITRRVDGMPKEIRDLSAKIIPILRRTSAELQEKAATYFSKMKESTTELSSVKAALPAEGSVGGGSSTEAKVKTADGEICLSVSKAEESQTLATSYTTVLTELLYTKASNAATLDIKSAGKMAKPLYSRIMKDDTDAAWMVSSFGPSIGSFSSHFSNIRERAEATGAAGFSGPILRSKEDSQPLADLFQSTNGGTHRVFV